MRRAFETRSSRGRFELEPRALLRCSACPAGSNTATQTNGPRTLETAWFVARGSPERGTTSEVATSRSFMRSPRKMPTASRSACTKLFVSLTHYSPGSAGVGRSLPPKIHGAPLVISSGKPTWWHLNAQCKTSLVRSTPGSSSPRRNVGLPRSTASPESTRQTFATDSRGRSPFSGVGAMKCACLVAARHDSGRSEWSGAFYRGPTKMRRRTSGRHWLTSCRFSRKPRRMCSSVLRLRAPAALARFLVHCFRTRTKLGTSAALTRECSGRWRPWLGHRLTSGLRSKRSPSLPTSIQAAD